MINHVPTELYGVDEGDDGVAVFLTQIVELLRSPVGITLLTIGVPHDCLHDITGTAVMQTVALTRLLLTQATAPERCRTAPAGTDIISHVELMLYEIGIRPDDGVVIRNHLRATLSHISLAGRIDPYIIFRNRPRRTMAGSAAHLIEELLTALYFLTVEVTGFRHTKATMPYTELIEVLIRHLFLAVPGSHIDEILPVSSCIALAVQTKELIDEIRDTVLTAVSIIGMEQ